MKQKPGLELNTGGGRTTPFFERADHLEQHLRRMLAIAEYYHTHDASVQNLVVSHDATEQIEDAKFFLRFGEERERTLNKS